MKTLTALTIAMAFGSASQALAQTQPQAQESSSVQRPLSQQEIDRLTRQINRETSSSVEAITEYHSESGDLNNRLDYFRYGGRLNLKFGSASSFLVTATRTHYMPILDIFREQGTNMTVGFQTRLSDSTEALVEAGVTRFSTDATSVNALFFVTHDASDTTRLYVEASRSNVEESLLSAAGIRPAAGAYAGELVGRVMENSFIGGVSSRPFGAFDVFGEGGAGYRAGSNVPSDFFKTIGGGGGYSFLARPLGEPLSLLRAAYEFNYFSFEENRFGFDGASLLTRNGTPVGRGRIGSDAVFSNTEARNREIGGFFSPQHFYSHIARLELAGGSEETVSYEVSGFVGTQRYTGEQGRWANGVSATITAGITDSVSLPVTYLFDNFGPFTQQSLYARLAVRF